jgi:WhiB family transcriptional regulator, redox-sensing transcriptional regulator
MSVTPGWHTAALCPADPDLFYGHEGENRQDAAQRVAKAKAICGECPVRAECLGYALGRPEQYGIWAGKTELERRALRRQAQRRASRERGAA